MIASEVRSLGMCGAYNRLFDLLAQFTCQVTAYRWMALTTTAAPRRCGLHTHPRLRERADAEARSALDLDPALPLLMVEDEDAGSDESAPCR